MGGGGAQVSKHAHRGSDDAGWSNFGTTLGLGGASSQVEWGLIFAAGPVDELSLAARRFDGLLDASMLDASKPNGKARLVRNIGKADLQSLQAVTTAAAAASATTAAAAAAGATTAAAAAAGATTAAAAGATTAAAAAATTGAAASATTAAAAVAAVTGAAATAGAGPVVAVVPAGEIISTAAPVNECRLKSCQPCAAYRSSLLFGDGYLEAWAQACRISSGMGTGVPDI